MLAHIPIHPRTMINHAADYSVFIIAFAASAAAPGPEIAALLSRTLAGGRAATLPLAAGIIAGKLLMLSAALLGLATLFAALGPWFAGLKLLGVAYLLYLGMKKWKQAGRAVASGTAPLLVSRTSELMLGLAMTLSNPIAIMFYLALLPGVIDVSRVDLRIFTVLCGIIVGIMGAVVVVYGGAAELARKQFSSPDSKKMLDRVAAAMMLGSALLIAVR
ncbi:LysE family translocator [Undibacterium sp.]|jgi:threonine/homoserine/homoserine lactone efflux protein|uniref:LysE family translocator n=1 Tax=Undibacterium sp. TaxID=1914977 RepID=UPI002CEB27F2|nr:LysE family translocator [Undibacterium sp.]HTD03621.1 LysE family translocator [Undibacterium sp.]